MFTQRTTSGAMIVLSIVGAASVLIGLVFAWPRMGDARRTVEYTGCVENLHRIYAAILLYTKEYGAIPIDDRTGRFSVAPLVNSGLLDRTSLRCPATRSSSTQSIDASYTFCADLNLSDLRDVRRGASGKVIACDNPGNHVRGWGGIEVAVVLFADGFVHVGRYDPYVYEKWVERFESVDEVADLPSELP